MNYKTILFDFDGTLLDSEEYVYQAILHIAKLNNLTVPDRQQLFARVGGKGVKETYMFLSGKADVDHMIQQHIAFQLEAAHLTKLFDEVRETLVTLKSRDCVMGLVSNRRRLSVDLLVSYHDIGHFFRCNIAGNEVQHMKPDPEIVLRAMASLQADVSHTLLVGDTAADLGAARAAGIACALVTFGHHGGDVRELNPNYVLEKFSELLTIAS